MHFCTVVKEFVKISCVVRDEAANMLLQQGSYMKRSIVNVQYVQLTCFKHVSATHLTHHNKFKSYLATRARKLVGHFHYSTLATEAIYSHQLAQNNNGGSASTIEQNAVKVIKGVST